jgi:hypothetical protein
MADGRTVRGWVRDNAATVAFYAYAFFLAPPLARALKEGLAREEATWLPGIVLLAALFAEPLGLRWKSTFLRRRAADAGVEPQGSMLGIFSAAGIAHVIVTTFVGMLALDCWGMMGTGENESSAWGPIVFTALVLKEFAGMFACAGQGASREAPGHWKEVAGELALLAYGCVAYTSWWSVVVDLEAVGEGALAARLALLPVFAGLFVFLYLPMRLPFLMEEHYLRPARGRKARIASELAAGAALGLYPMFF